MRAQAQKMMLDREKAEHEELQRFIRDKQREEEQKTGENGSKDEFLAKKAGLIFFLVAKKTCFVMRLCTFPCDSFSCGPG